MKLKKLLFSIIIFSVVISAGCSNSSWVSSFVVWDGYIYQISDEYVDKINEEIGEVTMYSDREGTYSGNFSNEYKKGTKYYSIEGISTDDAIAIKENDDKYRKAIRNGKYGE
ncbi:hypothetical protein JSQ81_03155 [Sporosarcina sp. Marseille-Q4063]|uniref:hypothetical protein n=1 Tax=Sporosarcina sp. Marseille-Q4063 TaxID=2810514 RepID=UPI001BAF6936|nr:hypothetical protein [Sporosarcina sp. Marseille-Q4063]QUW22597.1 hypothetical protein JSQ81_03155 [Sporosarcina sp. Marseille-Q4063]